MGDTCQQIKIERPLYEQAQLHDELEYHKSKSTLTQSIVTNCATHKPKRLLYKTVPILHWLSHYKWKDDLTSDLIAGFTVAVMHIPQGMGYGMLGNVPPIHGIYMAFFPVLVYILLGTSKHNSMGTFAVITLMTGKVVLEHSHPAYFDGSHLNSTMEASLGPNEYSPIQVATAVTFLVAVFQLIMYALRLGIISSLISETMVSGFTTGAAIHVFTSQVTDLFGYTLPKHKGYFSIVNTYISLYENLFNVNTMSMLISAITITVILINNEVLKPRLAKRCIIPIPIELIVIITGTVTSFYLGLHETYTVKIVGEVPKGLPIPVAPQFSLMNSILMDSLIIAIVSYTITLSMGLIFAQQKGYEIDANQELLAQGAGNMVGCFFGCMPYTASLSRSLIQTTVGGKTQLTSLVSCSILVFVLMWIGPYFQPLPRCVLASIIVVALKGMLFQMKDFIKFWRLSKMDAAIWMFTFLGVVLVDIDVGLLVGFVMSLITIFLLSMKPYTCLLGSVPHTDLYLDINRYKGAQEINNLKIFHYQGGLNFATKNYFRTELFKLIELDPQKELIWRSKLDKLNIEDAILSGNSIEKLKKKHEKLKRRSNPYIHFLILDFSALSYVDPSGVSMLKLVHEGFRKLHIPIYISGSSAPVYEMMSKCGLIDVKNNMFRVFPTIHDAVQYALSTVFFNENSISTPE